jgi:flagellar biosynthesis/type III secretory pathway protein FliH
VDLIDAEATMKISEGLKADILTSTILMSSTIYEEEFVKELRRRLIEMYDVDIFKEDRQKLLEQFEKEKQAVLEKGKIEGKIEGKTEALRENVSRLLLGRFKDSYTLQMKEAVNRAQEDVLDYITDHIFDISLEEVKKILFIS